MTTREKNKALECLIYLWLCRYDDYDLSAYDYEFNHADLEDPICEFYYAGSLIGVLDENGLFQS